MGMNDTPKGERLHIALFGRRNAGKSSIINAITGQDLAIVSDIKGTTTDPVYKAMELLPLGPVMIVDTPGLDDEGALGQERIKKAKTVLNKTDIALIIADGLTACEDMSFEKEILSLVEKKKIPHLVVLNKQDTFTEKEAEISALGDICVSAATGYHIHELKETISQIVPVDDEKLQIVGDLLNPGDFAVLVVPIDKAAPKGRLILPQQQTIRDILEADATAIVVKEYELKNTLANLSKKPKLVITDSQVFAKVSADTPDDILLTSFSILFARYKGDLKTLISGVRAVEGLKDGDRILMAEGCTHHRQCDDIGTVKIPRWLLAHTGKKLIFETSSGGGFPEDLSGYSLIVHCGGCTLGKKEMAFRLAQAKDQNIPIVNYGILIAYMQGILERSVEPFPEISALISGKTPGSDTFSQSPR